MGSRRQEKLDYRRPLGTPVLTDQQAAQMIENIEKGQTTEEVREEVIDRTAHPFVSRLSSVKPKSDDDTASSNSLIKDCLKTSYGPRIPSATCMELRPGLHILKGGAGTGKSVNALALAFKALRRGYAAIYDTIVEPRGRFFVTVDEGEKTRRRTAKTTASDADSGKRVNSERLNAALKHSTIPGNYYDYLHGRLTKVSELSKRASSALKKTERPCGLLLLDSVTQNLTSVLPADPTSARELVTYKGGLSGRAILGALIHSLIGEAYEVVIVGVINTDLMPVAGEYNGAVEGMLSSKSAGQLIETSRGSGRRDKRIDIPKEDVNMALYVMGYIDELGANSRAKERKEDAVVGYTGRKPARVEGVKFMRTSVIGLSHQVSTRTRS